MITHFQLIGRRWSYTIASGSGVAWASVCSGGLSRLDSSKRLIGLEAGRGVSGRANSVRIIGLDLLEETGFDGSTTRRDGRSGERSPSWDRGWLSGCSSRGGGAGCEAGRSSWSQTSSSMERDASCPSDAKRSGAGAAAGAGFWVSKSASVHPESFSLGAETRSATRFEGWEGVAGDRATSSKRQCDWRSIRPTSLHGSLAPDTSGGLGGWDGRSRRRSSRNEFRFSSSDGGCEAWGKSTGSLDRPAIRKASRMAAMVWKRSSGRTARAWSTTRSSPWEYRPAPHSTAGSTGSLSTRPGASMGGAPVMQRYSTAPSA